MMEKELVATCRHLIGQERALRILDHSLAHDEVKHAYMLVGPRGLGKTTAAMFFARALLKSGPENHPDFMMMEPQGAAIRIAEIRRLGEWLTYKAYKGGYRVAIIRQAHLMTMESANALLKTLEEPPSQTVLILTADIDNLPATIASRCQKIEFTPLTYDKVFSWLMAQGLDERAARLLALASEGSPGKAMELTEVDLDEILTLTENLVRSLMGGQTLMAYETAEALEKKQLEKDVLFVFLRVMLRDALVLSQGAPHSMLLWPGPATQDLAGLGRPRLIRALKMVNEAKHRLVRNVNQLLVLVQLFTGLEQELKCV